MKRFQEEEVWATGRFRVDAVGNVWRGEKRAENKAGEYFQVRAMVDGFRFCTCAHRLVWRALKGPIENGRVINHKNGMKRDNRPDNLECVSNGENVSHAHRSRLIDQRGEKNPASKLKDKQVVQIRLAYASGAYTQGKLAEMFKVKLGTISKIVRGDRRVVQGGPVADYSSRRNWHPQRDLKGKIVGRGAALQAIPADLMIREFPASA